MISITENAAQYITQEMTKNKGKNALRVSIESGGCSGHKYNFTFVDTPEKGDETITEHNVTVYLATDTILRVFGSVLDYEEDDFSAKLVFTNPNEKGRCGCGESVSF